MPVRRVRDIEWSDWKPTELATLVFVVCGDRLLLIRKKTGLGAGKINGPGGRVEPGESLDACALREVREELEISPKNLERLGELRFQFLDGYSIHVHAYRATDFEGTPTETREATPIWVDLQSIPYDEMWADDRLWLPLLLEGTRFEGRFIIDGDALVDHELNVLS